MKPIIPYALSAGLAIAIALYLAYGLHEILFK